jgi:hypothetical protein
MVSNLFTNEEFKTIVELSNSIRSHIPEEKASTIWELYQKIENTKQTQPCTCASSASTWLKAVTVVRDYIKNNTDKYIG